MRIQRVLFVAASLLAGQAAAQQPPAPQPPNRDVTLQNETDLTLREFYLAAPSAQVRGPDRLGQDVVVPGATYRVRLGRTRDCIFDAVAIFADDSEEIRRGVDICRNPRLVFGDPAMPTLDVAVANRAGATLRELYVSARGAAAWGPDRLGTEVIAPGASFALRLRTRDCVFGVRAVFADDREEVREGVDLCQSRALAFEPAAAPAATRSLVLANRHLAPVREVYLSPVTESDWGPDRLGAGTLAIGDATTLRMDGGCAADLRIVFGNGAAEERRALDLCGTTRIVLRAGWTVAERLDEDGAVAPPAGAAPAAGLRLRNAGPLPIVEIYVAAPGAPRREDRLGADTLPIGMAIEIEPDDPAVCVADIAAVFRDGREVARAGVDLCGEEEIVLR